MTIGLGLSLLRLTRP